MSKNRILVATDIGSSKVTTLVADIDEVDGLHIIGWGESPSNGIEKGIITNPNELIKSVRESLSLAENSSGFKITTTVVNISGQHIDFKVETEGLSFQNQSKEIDENDIASLTGKVSEKVPKDISNILHILPKKYLLDDELVLEPIGLIGSKLDVEFNIVTTKLNMFNNLKKVVESTGVEIIDFVVNPIASAMSVLFEEEKDLGVACVDIGASLSDIAIYKNGSLEYLKSLPLGGNLITKDIAYRFRISKEVAENIKKQLGMSSVEFLESEESIDIPTREDGENVSINRYKLVETIEWRLSEILEIVRKEIEKTGLYERLNAGIVITGGVANTPYIQQFAQEVLDKEVRIGKPKGYKGFSDKFSYPDFATGIGMLQFVKTYKLVNREFSNNKNQRNLNISEMVNRFFDKIKELF